MILVFGAGYTGARVAELAARTGEPVLATVRSAPERLTGRGFAVTTEPVVDVAKKHASGAHAVVCFAPDGVTDAELAPLLERCSAVSYISTTGVYAGVTGVIDDATPVPIDPNPRLAAEALYRAAGATVLRAPGIYGPDRGLHRRVVSGQHRIPGDGTAYLSRIHADDLARLLLASVRARGETFVVGDREPARQIDIVTWICTEYGCPFPPFVPEAEVHETLRANRRIDPTRALATLNLDLTYPTYRSGMARPR